MKLRLGEGLQIPIEVAGQAVALVGIRGSGKTNTAGVIAEELLDRGQPIVVLDPTDAWWGLRSDYPVFIFGGPHGDLPLNETDGKTLAEFVVQEKVPIILSLRHLRKGAQRRLVMEFCEELYHLKGKPEYREPLTVFIDEAPQFVPQRVLGEMARLVGAVQDMILLGRNAGFGVVLISQRFATLNADVRTQADTVIVHRLPSPLDRKALTEWIEENATLAEQKEVLSSLAMLKTGEAWLWAPYFDLFKRAQIRARKTFDSSAAPKRGAPARAPKDLTKVDLEKLKGKLAATIEKAKADDPKELRRQIAEKNKRISDLEKATAGSAPAKEGRKQEVKPVLTDADRALLTKLAEAFSTMAATLSKRSSDLIATANLDLAGVLNRCLMDAEKLWEPNRSDFLTALGQKGFQKILTKLNGISQICDNPPQPFAGRRVDPPARTAVARTNLGRPGVPAASGSSDLAPGERRILTAVAQFGEVDRGQLTVLVGYKASARDTYISRLATKGFVQSGQGRVSVTPEGVTALGADYEPLPAGDALLAYWRGRLPSGEVRVLDAIVAAYPQPISRTDLGEATGYKPTARDTYISRLASRRLVRSDGRGTVRASEELFN